MAIMKNMSVHFMGIFILFYVGLEVTLGSKSSPSYAPIPQVFYVGDRLDCHIHNRSSGWWPFFWICFRWILRRSVLHTNAVSAIT